MLGSRCELPSSDPPKCTIDISQFCFGHVNPLPMYVIFRIDIELIQKVTWLDFRFPRFSTDSQVSLLDQVSSHIFLKERAIIKDLSIPHRSIRICGTHKIVLLCRPFKGMLQFCVGIYCLLIAWFQIKYLFRCAALFGINAVAIK